jgi:integrase
MAGNIARRPDGRWRARYRDAKGKEHARHFDRKLDATRWLASVEVARSRGEWIDPALARVRVGDSSVVWLAGQVQLKPSTKARYELAVTRHILPAWESVQLSDVAYADVCQWVAELSALGLAPSTVRYSHRVFSLMLTHAVRDGRLARNPADGVQLPRITRAEPMFLDHGQVVELAEAAEPYGLLIRFLAYTGLRWGEMSALRVGSLDLLRRRMRIKSAFVEVKGKLVEGAPKTHQVRIVPLPRFLVDELAAHVERKGPDELVFSTPAGAPLRNTNFRRRHWDKAVKAAELDGLTPHDLRHTAASLAVAAGANVKAVQRMLGHASATMTLDVYAGLFGDDLDTVADLLDEAARRAAADSLRTRDATGRVLPFASGEGPRGDQGFPASPRGESNS